MIVSDSRPSKTAGWDYDFFVDLDAVNTNQVNQVVERLRKHTADVRVIGAEVQSKQYENVSQQLTF